MQTKAPTTEKVRKSNRIKPEHKTRTELYQKLTEAAVAYNETNDCAVKAVAVVTGVSYAEAHLALGEQGRKNRKGTWQNQTRAAVESLGFKMTRVPKEDMESQYPKAKTWGYKYKHLTTHHPDLYPEAWNDGNVYLINTRNHVAAVRDGVTHDWTKGRAFRIISIYRITKA